VGFNLNFGFNVNMTATFGFSAATMTNNLMTGFSAAGTVGSAQIFNFASSFGNFSFNATQVSAFKGEAAQFAPVPRPHLDRSGPPAGQGLAKDPPGWPKGSVRTAGGYTVVPEGNTSWKVYNPGQKPTDKPATHVHGDPHVTEKDGGRWDFTKSSDFVLPDGTRIAAKTSSETGKSVTTGLDITNGADRVSVSNLNGKPNVGDVTHDGYEWRARHLASNPARDTFKLGGDGDDWFLVKNGQNQGEITGAHYDGKTQTYQQHTNGKPYTVDPNLRPPIGSDAWGNMLRDQSLDFIAGQMGLPPWAAQHVGEAFHLDHSTTQLMNNLQRLAPYSGPFGGLYGMAFGFQGAFDAMGGMADAMNSLASLHASQMSLRGAFLY
jgi:hypothetical protein